MRRLAVAWVLCVLTVGAAAQAPSDPQGPANEKQQDAQEPKPHTREAEPSDGPPAPAQSRDEPSQPRTEEKKRQEGDKTGYLAWLKRSLTTFVDFADRNDKAIVAVGTILIAAFTVILGIATVFLWLATRALVRGADKTAERQLRAYVGIEKANVYADGTVADFRGNVVLKNFGQTPAFNMVIDIRTQIQPTGIEDFDIAPFPRTNQPSSLMPGGTVHIYIPGHNGDANELTAAIRAGMTIWIVGEIFYIDAFRRKRTTGIKLFNRAGIGFFVTASNGNVAT